MANSDVRRKIGSGDLPAGKTRSVFSSASPAWADAVRKARLTLAYLCEDGPGPTMFGNMRAEDGSDDREGPTSFMVVSDGPEMPMSVRISFSRNGRERSFSVEGDQKFVSQTFGAMLKLVDKLTARPDGNDKT